MTAVFREKIGTRSKPAPSVIASAKPKPGGSSIAEALAQEFDRVIVLNIVGARAPKGYKIFLSSDGVPRLDISAAQFVTRRGLKAKAVAQWLRVTKLPKQGFYEGLRLSPSTVSRSHDDKPLDPAVTERLVRHSDLMVRSAEVFGEGAASWMTKPHPLLEGATPLDAATNEYGGLKVREMLNAIEHGGVV